MKIIIEVNAKEQAAINSIAATALKKAEHDAFAVDPNRLHCDQIDESVIYHDDGGVTSTLTIEPKLVTSVVKICERYVEPARMFINAMRGLCTDLKSSISKLITHKHDVETIGRMDMEKLMEDKSVKGVYSFHVKDGNNSYFHSVIIRNDSTEEDVDDIITDVVNDGIITDVAYVNRELTVYSGISARDAMLANIISEKKPGFFSRVFNPKTEEFEEEPVKDEPISEFYEEDPHAIHDDIKELFTPEEEPENDTIVLTAIESIPDHDVKWVLIDPSGIFYYLRYASMVDTEENDRYRNIGINMINDSDIKEGWILINREAIDGVYPTVTNSEDIITTIDKYYH